MEQENTQAHSESEEIQVPDALLKQEGQMPNQQEEAIETMLEEAKISQKDRSEQVKLFKSKLVDFLTIYSDKGQDPAKIFHKIPDLLIYSFFHPDSSSKALANKIKNFIVKFFNKFSEEMSQSEFLEGNGEEVRATIDILFQLMKKLPNIKKSSKLVISIFRKVLKIEHEKVNSDIQENFAEFLEYCLKKKDIMYFECYAKPIMNYRKEMFGSNSERILDFIRLATDEGPRSDLMRVKTLNFLINYLRRLTKIEGGDAILKNFIKGNSKKIKKILASVLVEQNAFKKKPIKIYMKYLEFASIILDFNKKFGYKKRFASFKKVLTAELENLPKDSNLKKLKLKIETNSIEEQE